MIKATETLTNFLRSQHDYNAFAQKAGLTLGVVYALINGKKPSIDTVHKVLQATGLSYETAFEKVEESNGEVCKD